MVLVLLLAFAIRLRAIDSRSLWFDEAHEFISAKASFDVLSENVRIMYQPPLYTYILWGWMHLGIEPMMLRFLSVVLSMLSLVGLMIWGYEIYGQKGGIIAGFIMTILPPEIRYAQEVGEYALMGCVLTWSLFFLWRTHKEPTWKIWILWGIFSVLSIYSHYGTVLVIGTLSIVTFLYNLAHKQKTHVVREIVVGLGGLVLGIPLLYFLPQQFQRQSVHSIAVFTSISAEIKGLLLALEETFLYQLSLYPYTDLSKWIGQIILILLLFVLLATLVRSFSEEQRKQLWWFITVFICYFIIVRLSLYAYGMYGYRYSIILTPLFILSVVSVIVGLIRHNRGLLGLFLLLMVLGYAGTQTIKGYSTWPETKEDLGSVMKCWVQQKDENEITYVYYGAIPAFEYYKQLYEIETTTKIFMGIWFRPYSLDEKIISIRETIGDEFPHQMWIIFSHIHANEDEAILDRLTTEHEYYVVSSCVSENASVYFLKQRLLIDKYSSFAVMSRKN